jgi:hypothetical protein
VAGLERAHVAAQLGVQECLRIRAGEFEQSKLCQADQHRQ